LLEERSGGRQQTQDERAAEDAKIAKMKDGQFAQHVLETNPRAWKILGL
jgi:hypothetical protein